MAYGAESEPAQAGAGRGSRAQENVVEQDEEDSSAARSRRPSERTGAWRAATEHSSDTACSQARAYPRSGTVH